MITAVSSRMVGSRWSIAHRSMKCATPSSVPETEGVATRSRRRVTSVGEIDTDIRRLFLATHDHRTDPRTGEHLEKERIGGPPVDDVGALDAPGGGTNARLDLGAHPTGERAARHQFGKVVGVGEGHQG